MNSTLPFLYVPVKTIYLNLYCSKSHLARESICRFEVKVTDLGYIKFNIKV